MADPFADLGTEFNMDARQDAIDALIAERDKDVIETPQAPAPSQNPFANPMVMLNMALLGKADEALARGAAVNQRDMQRHDKWRDAVLQANNYRALRRSKMNTTIAEMRLDSEKEREAAARDERNFQFQVNTANEADDDRDAARKNAQDRWNAEREDRNKELERREAMRNDYRVFLREHPQVAEKLVEHRLHLQRLGDGMIWNAAAQQYQSTKGMSPEQISMLKAGMEDEVGKIGALIGVLYPEAEQELRQEYQLHVDAFDKVETEMGDGTAGPRETFGGAGDPDRFRDPNYEPQNLAERRMKGITQRDLAANEPVERFDPGIDALDDVNAWQTWIDVARESGANMQGDIASRAEQAVEAGKNPSHVLPPDEVRRIDLLRRRDKVIIPAVRKSDKWAQSDEGDAEIKRYAIDWLRQHYRGDETIAIGKPEQQAIVSHLSMGLGVSVDAAERAARYARDIFMREGNKRRMFEEDRMR